MRFWSLFSLIKHHNKVVLFWSCSLNLLFLCELCEHQVCPPLAPSLLLSLHFLNQSDVTGSDVTRKNEPPLRGQGGPHWWDSCSGWVCGLWWCSERTWRRKKNKRLLFLISLFKWQLDGLKTESDRQLYTSESRGKHNLLWNSWGLWQAVVLLTAKVTRSAAVGDVHGHQRATASSFRLSWPFAKAERFSKEKTTSSTQTEGRTSAQQMSRYLNMWVQSCNRV